MRYRVSIFIDGENFDPFLFQKSLPPQLSGEVRQRKYNNKAPGSPPTPFWRSREVVTESNRPEIDMLKVLNEFKPFLIFENFSKHRIIASLVVEYDFGEEPRGFFFDIQTINLLNDIGAELDIDAVPLVAGNKLLTGII